MHLRSSREGVGSDWIVAHPPSGCNFDSKASDTFFLSSAQAIVEAADLRARRIVESGELRATIRRDCRCQILQIVGPAEDGLNIETLSLAVLIVGCDALGWLGFYIIDAQYVRNTRYAS